MFLPGAAGASPLWLPHLPGCPCITVTRLFKWNQVITRTMVPLAWRVLLRSSWPMPCTKTAPIKKKRRVIVTGDSLLKGTEGPIYRPDPFLREICCFPGAWVKGVKRKFPTLVQPSVYYPLLIFQAGRSEVATRSLMAIK